MGDMADDFRFMKKVKKEEREKVEPTRFEYDVDKLKDAGYEVVKNSDNQSITINGYITMWPFTGWWSGKGIGSGRGLQELLKKLELL